jgi:RNA polymerase sigma-70 factor (ECF subfamily)
MDLEEGTMVAEVVALTAPGLRPGGAVPPPVPEGPSAREPERPDLSVVPDLSEPPVVPTWDEVVQLHSARVYRLAYRLTGNKHDAEDLTQEVFVRVFRSLSNYTPGNFEGWLHRITTNLFLDGARRRQRIRFDALSDNASERLASKEPEPATEYDMKTWDYDVQQALDDLSPEFRAAVVLCDVEGLSYEEIAATLDIKLGTVRSRIHRGRAQLRAALEHRDPSRTHARRPDEEDD